MVKWKLERQNCNLVNKCLELTQERGVQVVSLTSDGTAINMAMVSLLGYDFSEFKISL